MKLILLACYSVFSCCTWLSSEEGLLIPRPVFIPTVEQLIVTKAIGAGVDPRLGFWLAMQESGLDQTQERHEDNKTMSRGIMQLNSASFPGSERFTPEQNIAAGLGYLGENLRKCKGRPACAVRAYRSGHVE